MAHSPTPAHSPTVPEAGRRSAHKRRAILEAAEAVFLKSGYLGTNMDELAALSKVSKQTVYKHFGSKEALFVELVTAMTDAAAHRVHTEIADPARTSDLETYLKAHAERQLSVVMTPPLLQLRRLVIGEVGRFPDLAAALYERGPKRAIEMLAEVFERLAERGLLEFDDASVAASHFNWLIMGAPINDAMLLGDSAIPGPAELRAHAVAGVRVFLAAYATR